MRALLIIFLLGMLAAVGYFVYSAMAVEGEPIPTEGYVALALGVRFFRSCRHRLDGAAVLQQPSRLRRTAAFQVAARGPADRR
ncbi:hypothetical protein ACVWXL_008601 [Bradyrhizobium sp. GM22.5]